MDLVHGDIRNTDIMARRTGFTDSNGSFLPVDFNYCGEIRSMT